MSPDQTMPGDERPNDLSEGRAGGWRRLAPNDWLALAATPTFATMAVLNAGVGNAMAMTCPPSSAASAFFGMTAMYGLMGAFHLSPWLKLAQRQHRREP